MRRVRTIIFHVLAVLSTQHSDNPLGNEVKNGISDHNSYQVFLNDGKKQVAIVCWNVLSYGCRSGFLEGRKPKTAEEKIAEDGRISKRREHIDNMVNTCRDAIFVFQEVDEEFEKNICAFKQKGYDVLTEKTRDESFSLSILWNKNVWESNGAVFSALLDKIKSSDLDGKVTLDSQCGRYIGLRFKHKESDTYLIVCNVHLKWEPTNIGEAMRSDQEWTSQSETVDKAIPWVVLGDMNINISEQSVGPGVNVVVSQEVSLSNGSMNTVDGAFSNIEDVRLSSSYGVETSSDTSKPNPANAGSMNKMR